MNKTDPIDEIFMPPGDYTSIRGYQKKKRKLKKYLADQQTNLIDSLLESLPEKKKWGSNMAGISGLQAVTSRNAQLLGFNKCLAEITKILEDNKKGLK